MQKRELREKKEFKNSKSSLNGLVSNSIMNTPLMQQKAKEQQNLFRNVIQKQENKTGIPDNLKSGMENLSGMSLDHVKVHYNSSKPASVQAHAFAQGSDIHIASGQEKHLPHELGHVVQQAQGRVKPTTTVGGVAVNNSPKLESEATSMGNRALQMKTSKNSKQLVIQQMSSNSKQPIQAFSKKSVLAMAVFLGIAPEVVAVSIVGLGVLAVGKIIYECYKNGISGEEAQQQIQNEMDNKPKEDDKSEEPKEAPKEKKKILKEIKDAPKKEKEAPKEIEEIQEKTKKVPIDEVLKDKITYITTNFDYKSNEYKQFDNKELKSIILSTRKSVSKIDLEKEKSISEELIKDIDFSHYILQKLDNPSNRKKEVKEEAKKEVKKVEVSDIKAKYNPKMACVIQSLYTAGYIKKVEDFHDLLWSDEKYKAYREYDLDSVYPKLYKDIIHLTKEPYDGSVADLIEELPEGRYIVELPGTSSEGHNSVLIITGKKKNKEGELKDGFGNKTTFKIQDKIVAYWHK